MSGAASFLGGPWRHLQWAVLPEVLSVKVPVAFWAHFTDMNCKLRQTKWHQKTPQSWSLLCPLEWPPTPFSIFLLLIFFSDEFLFGILFLFLRKEAEVSKDLSGQPAVLTTNKLLQGPRFCVLWNDWGSKWGPCCSLRTFLPTPDTFPLSLPTQSSSRSKQNHLFHHSFDM